MNCNLGTVVPVHVVTCTYKLLNVEFGFTCLSD